MKTSRVICSSSMLPPLCAVWLASMAGGLAQMEFITIGNPSNAVDATGYGRVDSYYRIGKYEVKISEYAAFLNAVAATDPYGLYNTMMASDATIAGISRSGTSGSYTYAVIGNGDRPIACVSWFDAARMANWLHNGQPTGAAGDSTTEDGAYPLHGATSGVIAKNSGALVYLPTEDQWFKAAYYDPSLNSGAGGYWNYPTRSNSTPGNVVGALPNQVNYYTANSAPDGLLSVTQQSTIVANQTYLTPGGAFSQSGSAYGTFDQAGNLYELTDSLISTNRVRRGGCWWANNSGATLQLHKNGRSQSAPTDEATVVGFRLAAVASPEIVVEQPASNELVDGSAAISFGQIALGSSVSRQFTIRNTGTSPLSGLSVSADGAGSGDFTIGALAATTLDAGQSTTFSVSFTPIAATTGSRSAGIHIASNDGDENPFDIGISVDAFSPSADGDADGLNDWAEHQLAALGFDWQTAQPALVAALNAGANAAGLYTQSQIQTLNADAPLLTRNPAGTCKLIIGVERSADLASGFSPFPITAPQATVNAEGQIEFTFEAPDNAAFFRVIAR